MHLLPTTPLALIAGMGWQELLIIAIIFGAFAFWIWMIVDCAAKEQESGKVAWILVLVLGGIIGASIYFLVRKLPRKPATRVG